MKDNSGCGRPRVRENQNFSMEDGRPRPSGAELESTPHLTENLSLPQFLPGQ